VTLADEPAGAEFARRPLGFGRERLVAQGWNTGKHAHH
jgi:hypothetical protein